MIRENANPMNDLRARAVKMQKDLNKMLDGQMSKLSGVLRELEFKAQKKTKVNKMAATMFLGQDNSIRIVFDNPSDGEKFYGKKDDNA